MELTPGTIIGAYEIKDRLGKGGMGEVYYARDTRLGRFVALKMLLPELTANEDRLRRFKQEARTTSALNHPNIVTIFEVGETDSLHYLVTEFIDGVTLRHYLADRQITIREMLDIAIQVAGAVAAAHASAIVHRDLKPENIMRRSDGYVKVLDFGLAKLMPAPERQSGDQDSPTVMNIKTDPGSVVGTVDYMSPEQLRGANVDGRADIWGLGVVIYEMVAGRPPFTGQSKPDVIAEILRSEPPPLTKYLPAAPPDLQRVLTRALRKDVGARYQSAAELLGDLRELKNELDLDAHVARRHLHSAITETISNSAAASAASEAKTERVRTDQIPPARTTSSVEYLLSEIKRHRKGALALVAGVLLIAITGGGWFLFNRTRNANIPPPAPSISEIMTTSNVREAAISPDGRFIATVAEDAGRQNIRIQQPTNAGQSQVLASGDDAYRGLVFARDGYSIYYLSRLEHQWALYQVSVLGNAPPRKLLDDVATPICLSPDGTHLAFVRLNQQGADLMIYTNDGKDGRMLAATTGATVFGTMSINNGPAWSPDGTTIACPTMSNDEPFHMDVVAVKVADGTITQLGSRPWFLIGQMAWTSDGHALVMDAQDKMPPASTPEMWLLSYPEGEARPLTTDLSFYRGASLTADGRTLVTMRTIRTTNIWLASGFPQMQISEVPASKNKGSGGLEWTADGKIVYASADAGAPELWSMDVDGSNSRQLTFDQHTNVEPSVARASFDKLVFASYYTGQSHIWRMDRDGRNLRQLTMGSYQDWPDVSPDGRWVVYHNDDNGTDRIMKVPADGGPPVVLIDQPASHPIISPDGNWIACYLGEGPDTRLAILPFNGGPPLKTFAVAGGVAEQWARPRWTADGQAVSYIVTRGGLSNIWLQPVESGADAPPRQLTNFSEAQIYAFAWSPEGNRLACVRGADTRTVVAIRDYR